MINSDMENEFRKQKEQFAKEDIENARLLAEAKEKYTDKWVYLTASKAKRVSLVTELKNSPDGILVRVGGIGLVPINELRLATEEEIEEKLK